MIAEDSRKESAIDLQRFCFRPQDADATGNVIESKCYRVDTIGFGITQCVGNDALIGECAGDLSLHGRRQNQ